MSSVHKLGKLTLPTRKQMFFVIHQFWFTCLCFTWGENGNVGACDTCELFSAEQSNDKCKKSFLAISAMPFWNPLYKICSPLQCHSVRFCHVIKVLWYELAALFLANCWACSMYLTIHVLRGAHPTWPTDALFFRARLFLLMCSCCVSNLIFVRRLNVFISSDRGILQSDVVVVGNSALSINRHKVPFHEQKKNVHNSGKKC